MEDVIYLVMGKSGAGKDTVVNELCRKYGMVRLNSYTTRPCRGPGDLHEFVDSYSEWVHNNPNDPAVAYTFFAGNHYWASQSQVDASDLSVIDPDGVEYFRHHYNGCKAIRAIYIDVPWYIRLRRMRQRGDTWTAAIRRLLHDHRKFAGALRQADFVISNNNLFECVLEIAILTGKLGGMV